VALRATGRLKRRVVACAGALIVCAAAGQVPLDVAASRRGSEYTPALDGQQATVRGTVSSRPIQYVFYNHLAIQDESSYGLVLEGALSQFARFKPGDLIEVRGTISKRAGMPVLVPAQLRLIEHGIAPAPRKLDGASLQAFRFLGVLVTTDGRVLDKGKSDGGEYLLIGDPKRPVRVFLPLASGSARRTDLSRFDLGDNVRVTGIASQNCPAPPYNRQFQLVVSDPDEIVLVDKRWLVSPEWFTFSLAALGFAVGVWWIRERRMAAQRNMVRTFYRLGEEITGVASAAEIVKKLDAVLPEALRCTGVRLYLYSRGSKTLELIPGGTDSQAFSLSVQPAEGLLPPGAAACFRNQALLTIPDTRRSPFFPDGRPGEQPRSVMFVPMFAEADLLGVLEAYNNGSILEFTADHRVLTQHLANQIAIALRLMEEKSIREQLFRSEKLAAVGQLISGVAAELRSPLETISTLAGSAGWRDLPLISSEAKKASDIVARLVSFTQPGRAEVRRIELNALLRNLIEFRSPEWAARGVAFKDVLCPSPIYVLGSQGQLERVFLDMLVHAEHSLAETPEKGLAIGTSVLARRALVEIAYSVDPARSPVAGFHESEILPGEGVSRGIVRSHGGDIRLVHAADDENRLEIELPLAPARVAEDGKSQRAFTCLVVEGENPNREQLMKQLTNRGARVIPAASAEEGIDLVQRLRFDIVFCSFNLPGLHWIEFNERVQSQVGAFVLLSEGVDYEMSRGLLGADANVLVQPVVEEELDQLLAIVESQLAGAEAMRGLQVVRTGRKASSF
jgi:CheY-like chemotaxis protein